ncbi:sodium-coupled monocarboxylate transporter 1-like isoform X1 [Cimex lectularius]|uniref:Sodium-coupled monocarboxylate transporter 1 n=2 Tax=Cimex lectularius TaxID=79782 RepID=A0A8I6S6M9_CIMLE|nr:sodium-coupled monocarboxylate transporter 1-like isoform X1 [Cimex lectularius]
MCLSDKICNFFVESNIADDAALQSYSPTNHFGIADYCVFGGMLLISTMIGLYKSSSQKNTVAQFLTGRGKMSTVPVAISMLSGFVSSITLMGQPAEVYLHGAQPWLFGVSSFLLIPIVGWVLIPMFREKQYVSAYQYYGDRYNRWLQLVAAVIFTLQMIIYLALVLYAPALAMYQVTGLNTMVMVTIMYLVCIVYTTVGGIKAVVWTDCFQVLVLSLSLIIVLAKGTADIGGFSVIWERNKATDRTTFFNWDISMTERYTFWSSFIGSGFLHMTTYGGNQLQIQRYLTVKSTSEARKMLWINSIGWTIVSFMCVYAGMLIFANFNECDPLTTHRIEKADQLFPLYVMDALYNYPGFPGLFISGIFSAGLSSVSTGMNSLAAIWFAEFESTAFRKNMSETQGTLFVKCLALLFGILSYLVVFMVPYMGNLVPLAISLSSTFAGTLLGLFLLGVTCKAANTWGAFTGMMSSILLLCWFAVGAMVAERSGMKIHPPKPLSVDNCSLPFNGTIITPSTEEAFILYRISYTWYGMISIMMTLIVGASVSHVEQFISRLMCNKRRSDNNRNDINVNNLLLNEKELKTIISSSSKTLQKNN